MNFTNLNIENKLKKSIELAEFKTPTPIQSQSIPISLEAKVIWLQDGIISKEGKQMAKNNNMIYIENDCILRRHRSLNEF